MLTNAHVNASETNHHLIGMSGFCASGRHATPAVEGFTPGNDDLISVSFCYLYKEEFCT